MTIHTHARVTGLAGIGLLVGLGTGAVASAAIPDSNGAIHACYQTNSGALRVVVDDTACRNQEHALTWNQAGPAGQPGQPGEPGAPGGAVPGTSRIESDVAGPDHEAVARLNCPPGNYLANFGYTLAYLEANAISFRGLPSPSAVFPTDSNNDGILDGAEVRAINPRTDASLAAAVRLHCAPLP